jgi:NAD(P)-dependent dehydrogenase (short-subunit alcohol dehydrogenase family)
VVVADVSEQGNQVRIIGELAGRALAVRCDVTLDFAFNNAGAEQPLTATADLTEQEWNRIIDINLPRRVRLHEIRDPPAAPVRWRRDREHFLGRRG